METDTHWRASLNEVSAHFQGHRRRQQRTEHIPSLRIQIKIPDHAGNRNLVAVFEGRDSADYATATAIIIFNKENAKNGQNTCMSSLNVNSPLPAIG